MLKGKWITLTCCKKTSLNCHKEITLGCVVFSECIKEAKYLGWDIKNEICPECQNPSNPFR